jgi:hypothetical protein
VGPFIMGKFDFSQHDLRFRSWSCYLCQTHIFSSKGRVQLHGGATNWWSCCFRVGLVEQEPSQTRPYFSPYFSRCLILCSLASSPHRCPIQASYPCPERSEYAPRDLPEEPSPAGRRARLRSAPPHLLFPAAGPRLLSAPSAASHPRVGARVSAPPRRISSSLGPAHTSSLPHRPHLVPVPAPASPLRPASIRPRRTAPPRPRARRTPPLVPTPYLLVPAAGVRLHPLRPAAPLVRLRSAPTRRWPPSRSCRAPSGPHPRAEPGKATLLWLRSGEMAPESTFHGALEPEPGAKHLFGSAPLGATRGAGALPKRPYTVSESLSHHILLSASRI